MFLGRIITGSKSITVPNFIDVTPDEKKYDSSVPTLVIGRKRSENIFGKENLKVLDKRVGDVSFWTFGKTERRSDYEKELNNFLDFVAKEEEKKIQYKFFSFVSQPFDASKRMIEFLYSSKKKKYIFRVKNQLYIYVDGTNVVYGINLEEIDYIGNSSETFVEKMKLNIRNIFIEDEDFNGIEEKKRFKRWQIMAPYLYFVGLK
jgi:hypothetical protein